MRALAFDRDRAACGLDGRVGFRDAPRTHDRLPGPSRTEAQERGGALLLTAHLSLVSTLELSSRRSTPPPHPPPSPQCPRPRSTRRAADYRYCPIYLFNNALPLHLRYRDEHVIVAGFVPLYVPPPSAEAKLANMSGAKREEWLKAERLSLNDAVVAEIVAEFDALRGGVRVRRPGGTGQVVIPLIGVWQLDHPAHMQFCQCRQCGFCDIGGRGKKALADFECDVTMRSSELVKPIVERYLAAMKLQQSTGATADRDGKRQAKAEASRQLELLRQMGVNPWYNRIWDSRYGIDAYLNVSLSPLHILKGLYKDVIQWTLTAVCSRLGSKAACQRWLQRIDLVVIQQMACFSIVTGRIRRKGLSGILTYASRDGPFVVRGGSKVQTPSTSFLQRICD